jgi:hypothetical protein
MEKEFIPYEQALALKELEFNRRTFAEYSTILNNKWILTFDLSGEGQYPKSTSACIAPTFSQAFKWFREEYGLPSWIYESEGKWFWKIVKGDFWEQDKKPYTYEVAELDCLKKLIEIAKQK